MPPISRSAQFLPDLTNLIVQSCRENASIGHLNHYPLPRYDRVVEAIGRLRELLFPGYLRREGLNDANLALHVSDQLDVLQDLLTEQIGRALCRHAEWKSTQPDCDTDLLSRELTLKFLARLPDVRKMLATDAQAAYDGDPACRGIDEVVLCYPGLAAVTVFRLAHELHALQVPLIPRMMTEWAHQQTGIDIHPGASIGEYFFIDHGTGVVIGETCEIGRHVKLYQGVTLGALSFDTDGDGNLVRGTKRHPTVQDRVVIYANATILGGSTVVGNNSIIGSSVWLTRSVEPYTTVTIEKPSLRIRPDTRARSA